MNEVINGDLLKSSHGGKTVQYQVLLVEDDLAHERLIVRSFEAHKQYQLITRHTLSEAQNVLSQFSPDLIITDFRLPDGNGIHLLEKFLRKKACPVIFMTSFGDESVAVQAMKAGASDYVVKSDKTLIELPVIANRVLREWRLVLDKQVALEQQRRLTAIMEATPDLICIADIDGFLTYLNKAGFGILGLEEGENLNNIRLVDFHTREDALLIISEAIPYAIEQGMWKGETTFVSKKGEKILTSQVLITHKSATGEIAFFSTVATDIRSLRSARWFNGST